MNNQIFDRKGGDATMTDVAIAIGIAASIISIFAAVSTYRLNKTLHKDALRKEEELHIEQAQRKRMEKEQNLNLKS